MQAIINEMWVNLSNSNFEVQLLIKIPSTVAIILIVSCDRCRQFRARGRDTAGPHFAFHIAHCF